ncbi:MAG: hypothetical protein ABIZ70_09900 [Gemmatimonadales bacterium]
MFAAMFGLVSLVITAAAGLFMFGLAREFVRNKLRFVDAVKSPIAPWMAGFAVLIVAAPIAALLPLVTGFTAAIAGLATGLGTASGVKALKRGE